MRNMKVVLQVNMSFAKNISLGFNLLFNNVTKEHSSYLHIHHLVNGVMLLS